MSDHDAIAKRAYELYLERGSIPGYELEDWLTAEAEISAAAAQSPTISEGAGASDGARTTGSSGGKRGSGRRESPTAGRRALRT
jgi:hypothetical protein